MKKNDDLRTPKYIIDAIGKVDLDPCAGIETTIGNISNWNIERGEDGLNKQWFGFVYCNPPFSEKEQWIEKMIEHGNGILMLPERGSAPWFGQLAIAAGSYFVMGKKINFDGGSSSNNLGSALFLFGDIATERIKESKLPGHLNEVKWFNPR
jgi:hypothetical protein